MLTNLKTAATLDDLAKILGYKAKSLSFILYKIKPEDKYATFEITKRNGGTRIIHAPNPKLKHLQQRLANVLYSALLDIDGLYREQHGREPHKVAHGFAKKHSILTNAIQHKNRRYVFNIDLFDFFPTINFGRVRGVFIKDKRFEFDEKIATLIAQIACHENALPQGAPSSPVISNIVANILDVRLVRLAKKYKCTYSRYADDLTFSTNLKEFPVDLARPSATVSTKWIVGSALSNEISRAGFSINNQKTRMQFRKSRQMTTGLLVNEKVNVVPEYYRTVRSMCAALFKTGSYYLHPSRVTAIQRNEAVDDGKITNPNILAGMLNFIYQVKRLPMKRQSTDENKKSAIQKLYKKFLTFCNFIINENPLIITEGKTDSLYLKAALKRLTNFHPKLGEMRDGKFNSKIKYLNLLSGTINAVLEFKGGTGSLNKFIQTHEKEIKKFQHKPMMNPVIILIDNDDGAKDVFKSVNSYKTDSDIKISFKSKEKFYHIYKNIYVIKTPEGPASNAQSCIEDLFYKKIRDTKLDGCVFELMTKEVKDPNIKTYSKEIFARKIVLPNADTIDFKKFIKLFDRIEAAIDHYHALMEK